MTDEPRRVPITDRRRRPESESAADLRSDETSPSGPGSVPAGAARSAAEAQPERGLSEAANGGTGSGPASDEVAAVEGEVLPSEERDYLDDLRRLQADFENYKKRMMRQAAETGTRAKGGVIERLLPVLDNFERAISHGEGGEGVALVYKEFLGALHAEGLQEIPSEGVPFDPRVHEAVDAVFEEGLEEEISRTVYQRGYRLGEQVLRPARVVVARPAEEG